MSGHRVCSSIAGFTIFEALAATILMALVVSALGMMTSQWLPNWNRGINRLQSTEHLAVALDRIRADIQSAEFVSVNLDDPKPLFEGASRALIFVRTIAKPDAPRGLELVHLTEVETDQGFPLIRRTAPFKIYSSNDMKALRFGDDVVLIKPPYRLKLSYREANSSWSNAWHSRLLLPLEVKLTIEGSMGRNLEALSTSVRVRAQAPILCSDAASLESCHNILANPSQSAEANGKSKS